LLNRVGLSHFAITGEIAKKIPADVRRKYPAVAWKKMAGLRDIVVHDHFSIDEDIIWDVVSIRIPEVNGHIENMIGQMSGD